MIPTLPVNEYFYKENNPLDFLSLDFRETNYESGNISIYESVIIMEICKNLNPKNILEFGTFNGRTTTNIAANTPNDSHIVTVDLMDKDDTLFPLEKNDENDELGYIGNTNRLYIKYKDLRHKITEIFGDSAKFKYEMPNYFDFIFVDASHSYENVLNDTKIALNNIRKGGYIIWHDYNGWPGVTKALDEFYESLNKQKKKHMNHIKHTSLVIYHEVDN